MSVLLLHVRLRCRGGKVTAEIAIITRQAVALAADSAVTVGREKVWKTANKLFSLGPKHDIAVMVYGSGDFLSLPWEVVVKEYRSRSIKKTFATVEACADDFRSFLLSEVFDGAKNEKNQRYSVLFPLLDILSSLAARAKKRKYADNLDKVKADIATFRAGIRKKGAAFSEGVDASVTEPFVSSLRSFAAEDENFGEAIGQALEDDLRGLAADYFASKHESRYASGVVLAGFGNDEFFPSLLHFTTDGRVGAYLRWWKDDGCKNLNDPDEKEDFPIVAFAQQDMPFQFMSGISSDYLSFLTISLSGLVRNACSSVIDDFVSAKKKEAASTAAKDIAKKTSDAFMEELMEKVRSEQYLPINRAVMALPKEEMAMMAEALVDLTSLKRKVDSKLETVGGPVDVAVISKGDGFIWIKRKYYFDAKLNHDFGSRKKARSGAEHE